MSKPSTLSCWRRAKSTDLETTGQRTLVAWMQCPCVDVLLMLPGVEGVQGWSQHQQSCAAEACCQIHPFTRHHSSCGPHCGMSCCIAPHTPRMSSRRAGGAKRARAAPAPAAGAGSGSEGEAWVPEEEEWGVEIQPQPKVARRGGAGGKVWRSCERPLRTAPRSVCCTFHSNAAGETRAQGKQGPRLRQGAHCSESDTRRSTRAGCSTAVQHAHCHSPWCG